MSKMCGVTPKESDYKLCTDYIIARAVFASPGVTPNIVPVQIKKITLAIALHAIWVVLLLMPIFSPIFVKKYFKNSNET